MGNPVIVGTLDPVAKAPVYEFDPQRGYTCRQEWESGGDNLGAVATTLAFQRSAHSYTKSPHVSRIIATGQSVVQSGGTDLQLDTWQILANEIEKDVKEHPAFATLIDTEMAIVAKAAEGHEPLSTTGIDAGRVTLAQNLYGLLNRGTTHYATTQYVLRHTTNVASDYSANIADSYVEYIYTTAQLITETTNGSLWLYPLPGRLEYKLNQIPPPAARSNYLWGWRKLASTETTGSNGRVDITTEYWLDQWSTLLYSVIT